MNFQRRYRIGNGSGVCPSIHKRANSWKKSPVNASYTTNGHTLPEADTLKYTGISLQKHTSWSPHVHQAAKKAKTCAFLQHNLRRPPTAMRKWPILEYSKCGMGPTHSRDNPGSEQLYHQCVLAMLERIYWLGTSRGTLSEGLSHHSVLDSSQPCWHPSLRTVNTSHRHPHPKESEALCFMRHTHILWDTSMLFSLIV